MQSCKWCLLRWNFGGCELLLCGRSAVRVVLGYQQTDKPRDAFVQMQWRDWPTNTPLPYIICVIYHAEFGRSAL